MVFNAGEVLAVDQAALKGNRVLSLLDHRARVRRYLTHSGIALLLVELDVCRVLVMRVDHRLVMLHLRTRIQELLSGGRQRRVNLRFLPLALDLHLGKVGSASSKLLLPRLLGVEWVYALASLNGCVFGLLLEVMGEIGTALDPGLQQLMRALSGHHVLLPERSIALRRVLYALPPRVFRMHRERRSTPVLHKSLLELRVLPVPGD